MLEEKEEKIGFWKMYSVRVERGMSFDVRIGEEGGKQLKKMWYEEK